MNVAEDICPITDLLDDPDKVMTDLNRSRRPKIITKDGKPQAILLSPDLFPTKRIALHAACELADSHAN